MGEEEVWWPATDNAMMAATREQAAGHHAEVRVHRVRSEDGPWPGENQRHMARPTADRGEESRRRLVVKTGIGRGRLEARGTTGGR